MIERIIENWLTNANKRGYQIPFSQVMMLDGHTVVHISKHGPMEQGKDMITLGPDGIPCAYQLKAGHIGLDEWRKIKPQIDELVQTPIAHPSIKKKTKFNAYLVTNGEIKDPVRRLIEDMNTMSSKNGLPLLNVITKGELLTKFINAYESFFPQTPPSMRDYLNLYAIDGRGLVDKSALASLLEQDLFGATNARRQTDKELQRKIAASAVIMQQLISPFEKVQNHVGVVESWTLFCSYVLALAEKESISREYWRPTYDIIIQRINEQLEDLKEEFISRKNYLEQPTLGDGGALYKARLTIVLGWLCAHELFPLKNAKGKPDESILGIIERNSKEWLWYWGESATPYLMMTSLLFEVAGNDDISWNIVLGMLAEICERNEFGIDDSVFPSPYESLEETLMTKMPFGRSPLQKKKFVSLSYHLAALVFHAARRNKRTAVGTLWKKISTIRLCEYDPTQKWHFLVWRSRHGNERTWSFNRTQSWKELKELAIKKSDAIPAVLREVPEFAYYLLLVLPHRLTSESLRLVHETSS